MQEVPVEAQSVVVEGEHVTKHENMVMYEVSCVLSRTLSSGQVAKMQEDLRAAVKRAETSYAKWFVGENERLLAALKPKRASL